MTQEELAWSCDFAKAYLSQIESGKRLPSLAALVTIAKRLKVEPADLLVLDLKNDRLRLFEAVRKGDRQAAAEALKAAGRRGKA